MGAIPRSRTLSRSETAHKVTILNVCGSDVLIAIFVTVHAENQHRINRQAALVVAVRDRSRSGEGGRSIDAP